MCDEAPGLVVEKRRLAAIGGAFLGIVGDASHSFGFHLCEADDYSTQGAANKPVGWYSCAIDIGMNWAASRAWLRWLIGEIAADRITGIAEVIGSYDGRDVRYWSDGTGWHADGVPYGGEGHATWTHVAIYRSTALVDHGILAGWAGDHLPAGDDDMTPAQAAQLDQLHFTATHIERRGAQAALHAHLGNFMAETDATLAALRAAAAADETRDKATTAAIAALTDIIRAGGGNIDAAPILARIDAIAAAESKAVAELQARVVDLAARLAAAAQAEADRLAGP